MLDEDNPPCSNRRGQLYGTKNELIKHCKGQKDIRHKLIIIYLGKLINILFPDLLLPGAMKIPPKPKQKRTHKVKLKVPSKAEQKVGLKSPPQT